MITSTAVKLFCYMIEVYNELTSGEGAKPSRPGKDPRSQLKSLAEQSFFGLRT